MPERNYEEWKEIRARVDSISNAIFVIAGGALSLSITVALDLKGKGSLRTDVAEMIQDSWLLLFWAVLLMLLNKALTVLQAYLLQEHQQYHDRVYMRYNKISWGMGSVALVLFAIGMYQMVRAASLAIL